MKKKKFKLEDLFEAIAITAKIMTLFYMWAASILLLYWIGLSDSAVWLFFSLPIAILFTLITKLLKIKKK